jgi:hypothetical protein
MSYQTTEELNIIKTYSDIIFKGEWSILPIEIFIEYLRRICMNNLHKEAHEYLERERIYNVGWAEFDEEEDEEGDQLFRLNNLLLTQLENLKNNGIKYVEEIEYEGLEYDEDEKENFAVIFMVDVKFI